MIKFTNICKRFHVTVALDGVSFAMETDTVHALAGENGADKSTLMKIISGAMRPDVGTISIDNVAQRYHSPADALNAGFGIISSDRILNGEQPPREIVLGTEVVTPDNAEDMLKKYGGE